MPNKTITQLSPASSVADVDEFEVQVSGETVTKKATRKQVTQIEETARILTDDAIIAAVGLDTGGTYDPLADSWYLRTEDFTTGLTDRGGAEANVPENVMGALRLLDSKLYESTSRLYTNRVLISNSEARNLLTTPKLLINVSGIVGDTFYFIEVISCIAILTRGATPFDTTDNLIIKYDSVPSTNADVYIIPFGDFMASAGDEGEIFIHSPVKIAHDPMLQYAVYAKMAGNIAAASGGSIEIIITYKQHSIVAV